MSIEQDIAALTQATNALLSSVNMSKSSIDTLIANAAQETLTTAQRVSMVSGTYPNSAATVVPKGLTSTTSLVGGTGGTNGTFPVAFTGGGGSGAEATFTVSGGAVTGVSVVSPGYGYTSAPTMSFAASAGLTGASATAVIGAVVASGKFYWVVAADGLSLSLYQNVSGTATAVSPAVTIQTKSGVEASVLAANTAANRAETALGSVVVPGYDTYFTPFIEATLDGSNVVMDRAADYRGATYEPPLRNWPSSSDSQNYSVWTDNGTIWVRSFVNGTTRQRTTTPAHIRNLSISADQTAIFFEQYDFINRWKRMYIAIEGNSIAYPRDASKDFLCIGDSITNGSGASNGKLANATVPNMFYASSGYPTAFWLDSAVRAAGIEVYGFAFSGATSTYIADQVVALPDTDSRLTSTALVCIGRNNPNAVTNLADLERIIAKMKPYNKQIFGFDIPYRKNANGYDRPSDRAVIDNSNAAMKARLGASHWADTNAHMIDPGPNGALAIAIARGDVPISQPTSQDIDDLARGVPPASLIYQGDGGDVHPNDAGHRANWDVIRAMLVAAGGYF